MEILFIQFQMMCVYIYDLFIYFLTGFVVQGHKYESQYHCTNFMNLI